LNMRIQKKKLKKYFENTIKRLIDKPKKQTP